ncbi:MAG: hypothetical protein OEO77_07650 [Acidimicrobiia bacterium]|nr:hypothetical protein [Acidimicrobiia bacterium]
MQEFKSLADLLDLQDVDTQIDRLLHDRVSLPELDAYKKAHQHQERLARRVAELAVSLKATRLDLDKNEGELGLFEQKIEQQERRLFAGGLSAKDAMNLKLEVESLKRRQSTMEDDVLALLDRQETLEAEESSVSSDHALAQAEESRLEGIVSAAWKAIDAEIARKESRKTAIVSLIEGDLLSLYEKLRESKEGVAVGRLADGVCGGCHLTISLAEQMEVVRDDPPRCIHCRRILVP